jgi:hypothetical protein
MDFTDHMYLNTNIAVTDYANYFQDTEPNATVVTIGDADYVNNAGAMMMYCWHSVEGFSKVGAYQGNSDSDGSYIHCGFTPAFILIKGIDATTDWWIFDSERSGKVGLRGNTAAAEESGGILDIVSNGFKLRNSSYGDVAGTEARLFLAFAQRPFKNANGVMSQ